MIRWSDPQERTIDMGRHRRPRQSGRLASRAGLTVLAFGLLGLAVGVGWTPRRRTVR
jgi:hypothetical protein